MDTERDADAVTDDSPAPPAGESADDPSAQGATEGSDSSVAPDAAEGSDPPVETESEPDYKDLYLRAMAEADNVRKRARRDVDAANARGVARLARELLPVFDNLERALAHAEAQEGDEEHNVTRGIRLVQQDLLAALTRVGIEPFSPKGEQFDPHEHDAVAQQPIDGAEPGTVVEVYQQGYRYKQEVLRPAKVVVAA